MAWFAERGVTVERVLSDNGSAYRSHSWRDARADLGIAHRRSGPTGPRTNGKVSNASTRTPTHGLARTRFHDSEAQRRAALTARAPRLQITIASTPPSLQAPASVAACLCVANR